MTAPTSGYPGTLDEVTIKGYDRGFNCLLRVTGYGRRVCRVDELNFGVNVIPGSDSGDEARNRRVFYPLVTTGSSFGMVVVHASVQERDGFNRWVRGYFSRVSSGNTSISGTMAVNVPARRFAKVAIPEGTLDYGDEAGRSDPVTGRGVYRTTMGFVGATDPIATSSRAVSYFKKSKDPTAAYFYPAEKQVSGAESLEGTIFDSTPEDTYTAAEMRRDWTEMRESGVIPPDLSYEKYEHLVAIP